MSYLHDFPLAPKQRLNKTKGNIVNLWNSLPQDVVMADNMEGFKSGMGKFMDDWVVSGY